MGKDLLIDKANLLEVISGAKERQQEAEEVLFFLLWYRLINYFSRRYESSLREDLTQQTIIEVFSQLVKFDPTKETDDLERNFYSWMYSIAKGVLIDAYEKRRYEKSFDETLDSNSYNQSPPEIDENEEITPLTTNEAETLLQISINERLLPFLSEKQREVFELVSKSMSINKIIAYTGRSESAVVDCITSIRHIIEGEILYPIGFKPISEFAIEFSYQPFITASTSHQLETVKVFRRRYTTSFWVKEYLHQRSKPINEKLIQKGYRLLSEVTSQKEYQALLGPEYSDLVIRYKKRIYILPKDLEEFRRRYTEESDLVESLHNTLEFYTSDKKERRHLAHGIEQGVLPAVKKNGRWTVTKIDIENYLTTYPYTDHGSLSSRHNRIERLPKQNTPVSVLNYEILHKPIESFNIDDENLEVMFLQWFFTVPKIISDKKLSWRLKSKTTFFQQLSIAEEKVMREFEYWLDKAGIVIKNEYRSVVLLSLKGMSAAEVGRSLGIPQHTTERRIRTLRNDVNSRIFANVGLKRVSEYKNENIRFAVRRGKIKGVFFLGFWYTTDKHISEYREDWVEENTS